MTRRVGRWVVKLDRVGLAVYRVDRLHEWAQANRRSRIRGQVATLALVDDGGPGAGAGGPGLGGIAALAAMPRRDEPVGFHLGHLREAHELGRRGRPLRG